MLLDQASQVKKGMVVYYSHCFPKQNMSSFITCYKIIQDPAPSTITNITTSLFVEGRHKYIQNGFHAIRLNETLGVWEDSPYSNFILQQKFSLADAGIDQRIPRYNDHALFDDLDEAKNYIQTMLGFAGTLTIGLVSPTHGLVNSTSPGTPAPEVDMTPQPTTNADYDRAMRGI